METKKKKQVKYKTVAQAWGIPEKFSKGKKIYKTKADTKKIVNECKKSGVHYRIRKLKNGYRVDKQY